MIRLAVIWACISLAFGAADPPRCCADRQFQAVNGRVGGMLYPLTGNAVTIDDYSEMAYDYYRKRVGVSTHQRQPDGTMKTTNYLMDFANDRNYILHDGKCTVTTIGKTMDEPCIPVNATFLGSSTLGYGVDTLRVNTWEYAENGVIIKVASTENGCVPVLTAVYGIIEGTSQNYVEVYSSFKPGIDTPSNLDLPDDSAGCVFVPRDPTSSASKPTSAPIIGRRSIF